MNYTKKQGIIFFTAFFVMLLFTLYAHAWTGALVSGFCIFMGIMVFVFPDAKVSDEDYKIIYGTAPTEKTTQEKNCLVYYGDELKFEEADIVSALNKNLTYFVYLSSADQQKFIKRLNKFIADKTFKIHDSSGFREMPILISAAAIQLSFGLENYLLPNFEFINIYPEEFISIVPTIRFLEGNVSSHSINISWKFFLNGFRLPNDGENVGLHEMAHAYYYQNFGPCDMIDKKFVQDFKKFNTCGNDVFQKISQSTNGIYPDYAKKNFQEFWAESVELFFEKPMELRNTYNELYECICEILNQNPADNLAQLT
ncbi:MAG: zinc-dependent peptidase [Ginsengibacter sp.]